MVGQLQLTKESIAVLHACYLMLPLESPARLLLVLTKTPVKQLQPFAQSHART